MARKKHKAPTIDDNAVAPEPAAAAAAGVPAAARNPHQQADMALQESKRWIRRQTELLSRLMARGVLFRADLATALAEITEAGAEIINTERVSVWSYNEDHSVIRCLDLYERSKARHNAGEELRSADFPSYTNCHLRGEIIAATNVRTDPRTREISAAYWDAHDIYSLMDAPVWRDGRLGGLIRFEAVGAARSWSSADEHFCAMMASLVSLCFAAAERNSVEAALRSSEAKYRTLLQVAPVGIGLVINRVFQEVNETLCRMTGYTRDELLGQNARLLYPTDEDYEYVGREKYRQIAERGSGSVQTRWRRKDSEIRNILLSSAVMDPSDPARGVTFTALDITDQVQAEVALQRKSRLQTLLIRLSTEFINLPLERMDAAIQNALQEMASFVAADRAYVFDYDFRTNTCSNTFEWCAPGIAPQIAQLQQVPLEDIPEWVTPHLRGETIIIPDVAALPAGALREILEPQEIKSLVTIPLIGQNDLLGFVGFDFVTRHYICNDEEIGLLRLFGQMLVNVAERRRLEEALATRVRQQAALAELSRFALSATDLPTLFDRAVAQVAETFGVEYCKILELQPDGETMKLAAGVGWRPGLVGTALIPAGRESQAGYTLLASAPVVIEDLRTETRFSGPALLHEHSVVSGISVMIAGRERPFGVLGAHTTRYRRFTADDIHFVQAVANLLAEAIQRRRIEEALATERTLLRTLVDHLPDVVYVKDLAGRKTLANPADVRLMGLNSEAEALGKSDFDVYPAELAAVFTANDRQVFETGQPIMNREERIIRSDGTTGWLLTSKVPLRDSTGQIIGLVGIGRDITERVQMEEQLRATLAALQRSNADLERFAYLASHDLQEPLRMVASFVELLKLRYQDRLDADADEFISYAVEGVKRMQQMILDLLEYLRAGMRNLKLTPTDMSLVCQTALQNLELAIAECRAVIECEPLPTVQADAAQLVQVFQNLISNALKFRRAEPPRVRIWAERRAGNAGPAEWLFAVQDNGLGIEPEHRERIFVMLQRLHRRGEYPGRGIGLAICKRIIERHGGRIWVESTPGQGSTFYFTLPAH